ncbi:hypothetical protein [Streptomyces canus]|uniref:hypothetical protein n=1 Tax=Streptomyces canus TaxID=58343 RepID=UPI00371CD3AA
MTTWARSGLTQSYSRSTSACSRSPSVSRRMPPIHLLRHTLRSQLRRSSTPRSASDSSHWRGGHERLLYKILGCGLFPPVRTMA